MNISNNASNIINNETNISNSSHKTNIGSSANDTKRKDSSEGDTTNSSMYVTSTYPSDPERGRRSARTTLGLEYPFDRGGKCWGLRTEEDRSRRQHAGDPGIKMAKSTLFCCVQVFFCVYGCVHFFFLGLFSVSDQFPTITSMILSSIFVR